MSVEEILWLVRHIDSCERCQARLREVAENASE